jgi:isoleucyl-tRNA synthetase
MLGALDGFSAAEAVTDEASMPELERWVLHRLTEMDAIVRRCCDDYEFQTLFAELTAFCTNDLSAFYFDIRKDSLYCDLPSATRRRACRTVLNVLFERLTAWLGPIMTFTAEEVCQCEVASVPAR